MLEQVRALTEVVQQQRGKDDRVPTEADRSPAEVAHVGVERFAAGDAQHHAAQHREPTGSVGCEEAHRVGRVHRLEHRWCSNDVVKSERGD
jgi:hypothetical protein